MLLNIDVYSAGVQTLPLTNVSEEVFFLSRLFSKGHHNVSLQTPADQHYNKQECGHACLQLIEVLARRMAYSASK